MKFLDITLCFRSVSMYFVDSLLVLSKVDHKISASFGLIQNFEISDLTMAKVKKVNIAVTYHEQSTSLIYPCYFVFV
jgi:hypothetical protein